ncbi:homeobox protein MSH-C-like [Mytilus californianus]|uniref:homeobox protein MSH-C-like n=1 Tax=Mytilus californianus TaxID=6549 RepID=UPI0022466EDF|nr:homeobox protein MSH-C-like [Mytilus californianus]
MQNSMDMLASFFAGSYAVYNRMNPQRRQELYSNFGYYPTQIPQLIPLQTVSNAQISSPPESDLSERKTKPDEERKGKLDETPSTSKERMKFSIDSILNDSRDVAHETKTIPGQANINVVDSDETDDEDDSLPWLQCTRYKPPKLPRNKRKDCIKKRKLGRNPRVPFTQHQVAALEQKFRRTQYLSSMDVAELSTLLNLTETRVKIWFQNRRARERRDREAAQRGQIIQNKQSTAMFSGMIWPFSSNVRTPTPPQTFPFGTSTSNSIK